MLDLLRLEILDQIAKYGPADVFGEVLNNRIYLPYILPIYDIFDTSSLASLLQIDLFLYRDFRVANNAVSANRPLTYSIAESCTTLQEYLIRS